MITTVAALTAIYLSLIFIEDVLLINIPDFVFPILIVTIIFFFFIYPICAFIGEPIAKRAKERAGKQGE